MLQPRRRFLATLSLGAFGACSLSGCRTDGNFSFLGYSTQPNYDTSIATVYVPTFQNKVFQTTPHREMEQHLTRAVIREIEVRTPYKVIDDPEKADTELLGTIVGFTKVVVNRTQQNDAREVEYGLTVELVYRDLRDGGILTNPRRAQGEINPSELPAFDPNNTPLPKGPDTPRPVRVLTTGRGIPELGETSTTGEKMAVDRMAVRIVSMMEKPWTLDRDR